MNSFVLEGTTYEINDTMTWQDACSDDRLGWRASTVFGYIITSKEFAIHNLQTRGKKETIKAMDELVKYGYLFESGRI